TRGEEAEEIEILAAAARVVEPRAVTLLEVEDLIEAVGQDIAADGAMNGGGGDRGQGGSCHGTAKGTFTPPPAYFPKASVISALRPCRPTPPPIEARYVSTNKGTCRFRSRRHTASHRARVRAPSLALTCRH